MAKTQEQIHNAGELLKVCDLVQCPYNDNRNGCQRYTVACHCHLAWPEPRQERDEVYTQASQYWLMGSHMMDLPEIQKAQDEFLSSEDEQRRLRQVQRLKEVR